jgi:hypothetical protein
MKTVRSFLLVPALFSVAGIAGAQHPPAEEIRQRALAAIESNSEKMSDVLFHSEEWNDLSSRQPGVHLHTPALLSHFELVDHNPVYVLDRWEDQPPFESRYPALQQRMISRPSFPSFEYAKELLNGRHPISFIGMKTDRTRRAYVLMARPSQTASASASAFGRCAASLNATLMIDSETFFPIRVDAEVVNDQGCSYQETHNNVLNQVGTRMWFHSVRVSGKDRCGEIHDIYVFDRALYSAPFEDVGAFVVGPRSIAERTFRWRESAIYYPYAGGGPSYSSVTHTSVSSEFKMFLTGSCISFDDASPRSDGPSQQPVDFVQTGSYFNIDGTPTIPPVNNRAPVNETYPYPR